MIDVRALLPALALLTAGHAAGAASAQQNAIQSGSREFEERILAPYQAQSP